MPAKMISEMPLPTPRAVICSPSHIRKIVPPTSVMTVEAMKYGPGVIRHRVVVQRQRHAPRLRKRENDGEIAGVLVDLLAAALAFLLEALKRGNGRREDLDDDRRRDVRHHVQREDGHALDGAAGERVPHSQDALLHAGEGAGVCDGVEAGDRDLGADAVDDQRDEREPDTRLQLLRLAEGREGDIASQLLGRGNH